MSLRDVPTDRAQRRPRCDGSSVQSGELRDDSRVGAGWDAMLLENGEPLLSRRCANEREARLGEDGAWKDLLRTGCAEDDRA
jgi:hypothetical protein